MEAGESFGNFRVVKCLTAGLIANYYHMQHVRDLSDVTVGIFHSRTVEDGRFVKRLQSLQKTLENFDHESIPKIKDSGLINGRHCIFLEPVRGQPLSQYFETHGQPGEQGLDTNTCTRVMAQLLGVLGYAHSKGLDHRDLESDLIFIQEDGSLQILGVGIKLTLGVELFESIVSASVSPLVSNKSIGRLNSFDVMSPEYKAGQSEDSRVDVFAVGMIGYWLVTGHKAGITTYHEVSTHVEGLSDGWDVFFRNCIARESDARYRSCKIALLGIRDVEPDGAVEAESFVQRQIDRILAPKKNTEDGASRARVFRLCLIGLVGVSLTALAAYFMRVSFTESEGYSRNIAQQVVGTETPNFVVSVKPSVAKIQFVDFGEKFVSNNGVIRLRVQAGKYDLAITAPHHNNKRLNITIPEGKLEPVNLDVELQPAWADIKVSSEPNATISVIDERGGEVELGVTNSEGIFFLKKGIFAGTYQILVDKEGYASHIINDQEIAFGEITELKVELMPLPTSLQIHTQPEGARILVNDEPVGVTPLTLESIEPGKEHLIVAHLDGCRSLGRRVEVSAGQQLELDFGELAPRSGTLAFDVSFLGVAEDQVEALIKDLSVELNGDLMPYADGVFEGINEGLVQVRLIHPLYISAAHTINVADSQKMRVNAQLSPRPGMLELVIPKAMSASLRVDGKLVELVDGRVGIIAGQAVQLELSIQNHLTMTREVTLDPNEHFVWEVEPVAIPGPQAGKSWTIPYLGHAFVWVPAGVFTWGSLPVESGRLPNEGPQTEVRFTQGFWVATHEVTQAKFVEIMGHNPSNFVGLQKPVESVTWAEAKQFCQLLTQFGKDAGRLPEGYIYRLPTEAEWEYVARAQTETAFSFGAEADLTHGNFRGVYPISRVESATTANHYGTLPVGSYKPNAFGLYDVHGNVQEWTLDFYNGRLPGGQLADPAPRADGSRIAVKGGSWEDFATAVRSAIRQDVSPETRTSALGFRIVLAPLK